MAYKSQRVKQYPVEIDTDDLHTRMWAAMHVAGITIQELSDFLGADKKVIRHAMEGHRYHLSIDFLINFCAYVGCTVADILPFANSELPVPSRETILGGGLIVEIAPDPYRINYADAEDLQNAEVNYKRYGADEE